VTRLSGGEGGVSGEEEEEEEEEEAEPEGGGAREARSLWPAVSSLVTLQNNSSPGNTNRR